MNILKDAPDIKSITEWVCVDSAAALDVCSCCGWERGPIHGVSLGPSLLSQCLELARIVAVATSEVGWGLYREISVMET